MKLKLNRRTLALALGGLALLGSALIAPAVRAQDAAATEPTKPISLSLHNVPIQTALQLLFTGAGIRNTSIDSDVQGYANINVSEVPFSLALRTLLSSVNPPLSYTVDNGIYHVSVQRAVAPPAPPVVVANTSGTDTGGNASTDNQQKGFYHIPIDKYDAYYIARLLGATGIVQVGVNDVIPANGNNGGGNNTGGNTNGNRGFGGTSSYGGNTGFGGSSGYGGTSGFGGSGPNITSVGGGTTGGFGGGYGGGGGGRFRNY